MNLSVNEMVQAQTQGEKEQDSSQPKLINNFSIKISNSYSKPNEKKKEKERKIQEQLFMKRQNKGPCLPAN